MTAVKDISSESELAGVSPIVWSNVTDGAISLSPTGSSVDPTLTWVLIATVPFATGANPLNVGDYGILHMSWHAKSATSGKFSIAKNKYVGLVQGASPASSNAFTSATSSNNVFSLVSDSGFLFEGQHGLAAYVPMFMIVNGSGDLEIYLDCYATDNASGTGVSWDITGLSAEYRIVGCS